MKNLSIGIILVILIGAGAFVYRNSMEHTVSVPPADNQTACTLEARICPDGTSVGRTGPNCEFAACAFPNAEDKEIGISFVVPTGFAANADAIGADPTLRAVFDATVKAGETPDSLIIRRYPIPAGKTGNDVILANTMHESSGIQAASMKEFTPVIVNGKTYQSITVERFEAMVHTEYYLVRANDVLRFEVVERNVTNWTDPNLKVESLPSHKALLNLLATLQSN